MDSLLDISPISVMYRKDAIRHPSLQFCKFDVPAGKVKIGLILGNSTSWQNQSCQRMQNRQFAKYQPNYSYLWSQKHKTGHSITRIEIFHFFTFFCKARNMMPRIVRSIHFGPLRIILFFANSSFSFFDFFLANLAFRGS